MKLISQADQPFDRIARELVGADHDLEISILVVDAAPGRGPALHRHPYAEVFVTLEGEATFTVDGAEVVVRPGDVVVADAGETHCFVNSGSGPLRQVNIHLSPRFVTDWLDETGG